VFVLGAQDRKDVPIALQNVEALSNNEVTVQQKKYQDGLTAAQRLT